MEEEALKQAAPKMAAVWCMLPAAAWSVGVLGETALALSQLELRCHALF